MTPPLPPASTTGTVAGVGGPAILDLLERDHYAMALAAQIVSLTLDAQKEIERFVEDRDWRGARYREEMWREAVSDACIKANAAQAVAFRHVQKQLTDILVDELRLPPAMPKGAALAGVGGPVDPPTANLMADKMAIAYASPDWSKLQGVHWIEGEPATTFADRISAALAHQEAEHEEGAAMLNEKGETPHGESI